MGGRLAIHVTQRPGPAPQWSADHPVASVGATVARRLETWAARLTRFDPTSELSKLNADPRSDVPVGPTLGAVLAWAAQASRETAGIVDPTLLDARLAAEGLEREAAPPTGHWDLRGRARSVVVRRPPGMRFDLDGIAKGWLADRALRLLSDQPGAVVDADGDIAVRVAPGDAVCIGVADPRSPTGMLAVLRLPAHEPFSAHYGIATSGTSVHRWPAGSPGTLAHHLIDPRTRRSARTDVVQATVLAGTARRAEALAKMCVILGSAEGLARVDAAGALAAVVLTESGECLATDSTLAWLTEDCAE